MCSEKAESVNLIGGMIIGALMVSIVGGAIVALVISQMKYQAVARGYAEYVVDGDRAVWRWKENPNGSGNTAREATQGRPDER